MSVSEAGKLLDLLKPWLWKRCGQQAERLPGIDPTDLAQEACVEFLKDGPRWLQQAPKESPEVQAKRLLGMCIKRAARSLRDRICTPTFYVVQPGDTLPGIAARFGVTVDDLKAWNSSWPGKSPGQKLRVSAYRKKINLPNRHEEEGPHTPDDVGGIVPVDLVQRATTPPRALCVLSLHLPACVECDDARRAKEYTKGGSGAVPRALEAAWAHYEDGRGRLELVASDVEWKRHVAIAWYTDGPVESVPESESTIAVGKVERYSNLGLQDLRKALLSQRSSA